MKRHLPLILTVAGLGLIGQFAFPSTTQDGARVITGQLTVQSLTGIARGASGVISASELSGDATTSGSNAVSVIKVNGSTPGGTCTTPKLVISLSSSAIPTCAGDAAWSTLAAGCAGTCFGNSWVDFGMGLQAGQFIKDAQGWVHLSGVIKPGTTTAATTMFTLPAGFRPPSVTLLVYGFNDQGSAVTTLPIRCGITTGGAFTNQFTFVGSYLSLDGIAFSTF